MGAGDAFLKIQNLFSIVGCLAKPIWLNLKNNFHAFLQTSSAVQKDVSGTYSFKLFPASTEQFSRNLI